MTYAEKLKDPRWQKRKGEILLRDSHTCRSCGATDITLHAHHLYYKADTDPWDYPNEALLTLCEICHNTAHLIGTFLKEDLIEIIKTKPLLIHMVSQLCILCEEMPSFEVTLRNFLNGVMSEYYQLKKYQSNG